MVLGGGGESRRGEFVEGLELGDVVGEGVGVFGVEGVEGVEFVDFVGEG